MKEIKIIDTKRTVKAGENIMRQYTLPLQFFKSELEENDYINSTSLISVSKDLTTENTIEKMYLKISDTNEAVRSFFDICKKVGKINTELEKYLLLRYYLELPQEEIKEELYISRYRYYSIHNEAMTLVATIFKEEKYVNIAQYRKRYEE
jgi:hypothetical protein